MLELTCSCLTPEAVLEASGHVEKFADYMVRDLMTGNCHRADKVIGDHVTKMLSKKKKSLKPEDRAKLLRIQQDCESYNAEELN